MLSKHKIPGFGVCLGLQGMVEYFGGTLGVLGYPMHGKPSPVFLTPEGKTENSIFAGLPDSFEVARYHSLHGIKERLPSCLTVTALSEDGIVMGLQHNSLPFAAVQFHPESILTSPAHGMTILRNALAALHYKKDGEEQTASAAELVGQLEQKSVAELEKRLKSAGLSATGSKSELIVRLALFMHKSKETKAGRNKLEEKSVVELKELKQSLGLKGAASTKDELLQLLKTSLLDY